MDWSDLQHFLALAQAGSMAGAADRLGVNRTTVTRHINDLEAALGTSLFERQGRRLALTDAGREVLNVAQSIDGDLASLERAVFGRDQALAGTIRLTTTAGMAALLADDLARFHHQHPELVLELMLGNALEDLEMMESDLAIRLTTDPPENLVGRKVANLHSALYASPELAARIDRGESAQILGFSGYPEGTEWIAQQLPVSGRVIVSSNNMDVLCELAARGLGATEVPCYIGEFNDSLVRISEPHPFRFAQAWLLYHPQLRNLRRVHLLVDHLVQAFGRLAPAFEGKLKPRGWTDRAAAAAAVLPPGDRTSD